MQRGADSSGVHTYGRTEERTTRDEDTRRGKPRERVSLRFAAGRFAVSHFNNDDDVERRWRRRNHSFFPLSEETRARACAIDRRSDGGSTGRGRAREREREKEARWQGRETAPLSGSFSRTLVRWPLARATRATLRSSDSTTGYLVKIRVSAVSL